MTLRQTNETGNRLDCLRVLADTLAKRIDECENDSVLAQLARQYRETQREIAELEPADDGSLDDIIGDLPRVR